jgi:hypothetical protein
MKTNRLKKYIILMLSMVIPGAGHVILKRPTRGLFFIFWMYCLGYITYQITSTDITLIGRLSGGIAVWVLSVLEVDRMLKLSLDM